MVSIDEELSSSEIKKFLEKNKHLVLKWSKRELEEDKLSKFEVVLNILKFYKEKFKDNFLGDNYYPCYLLEGKTYSQELNGELYEGDFRGVIKPRYSKINDALRIISPAEMHFCFSIYGNKRYMGRSLSLEKQIKQEKLLRLPFRLNAIIKEEPNLDLNLFKASSRAPINPREQKIIKAYFKSV